MKFNDLPRSGKKGTSGSVLVDLFFKSQLSYDDFDTISFTKGAPYDVDYIDAGLALTRGATGYLFNPLFQTAYSPGIVVGPTSSITTPTNTLWSPGWGDNNYRSRTYTSFYDAVVAAGGSVSGYKFVMHDTGNDKFWLFNFSTYDTNGSLGYTRELAQNLDDTRCVPVDFFHLYGTSPGDAIDTGLTIERSTQGIYNSDLEGGWGTASPLGTSWNADGWNDLTNVESRTYTSLYTLLGNNVDNSTIGVPLVMKDTANNRYYRITFTDWTTGASGGENFSYTREEIVNVQLNGVIFGDGSIQRRSAEYYTNTLTLQQVFTNSDTTGYMEAQTTSFRFEDDHGAAYLLGRVGKDLTIGQQGSGNYINFVNDTSTNRIDVIGSVGATFQGLVYYNDYSTNYVDRSLVDKQYVDILVAGGTGGTGGYLPLTGGTMSGAITMDSANKINFIDSWNYIGKPSAAVNSGIQIRANRFMDVYVTDVSNVVSGAFNFGLSGKATFTDSSGSNNMIIEPGGLNIRFTSGSTASYLVGTAGGYTWTLPGATGTIALTSDISGYLPLTGGTMSGPIYMNIGSTNQWTIFTQQRDTNDITWAPTLQVTKVNNGGDPYTRALQVTMGGTSNGYAFGASNAVSGYSVDIATPGYAIETTGGIYVGTGNVQLVSGNLTVAGRSGFPSADSNYKVTMTSDDLATLYIGNTGSGGWGANIQKTFGTGLVVSTTGSWGNNNGIVAQVSREGSTKNASFNSQIGTGGTYDGSFYTINSGQLTNSYSTGNFRGYELITASGFSATTLTGLYIDITSGTGTKYLATLINGNQGAGKVLTSDANGNVDWATPAGASGAYLPLAGGTMSGLIANTSGSREAIRLEDQQWISFDGSPQKAGIWYNSGLGASGQFIIYNDKLDADIKLSLGGTSNGKIVLSLPSAQYTFDSTGASYDANLYMNDKNVVLSTANNVRLFSDGGRTIDMYSAFGTGVWLEVVEGNLSLYAGATNTNSVGRMDIDAVNKDITYASGTTASGTLSFASVTDARIWTLPDVTGTLTLGTGTTDYATRWTSASTLSIGKIRDNGLTTAVNRAPLANTMLWVEGATTSIWAGFFQNSVGISSFVYGLVGDSNGTSGSINVGVEGRASSAGTNYGLRGLASGVGSQTNYSLIAEATSPTTSTNYAGYFDAINASGPAFSITAYRGSSQFNTIGGTTSFTVYGTSGIKLIEASGLNNNVGIGGTGNARLYVKGATSGNSFVVSSAAATDTLKVTDLGIINMPNLPTGATGLTGGDLWDDNGFVRVSGSYNGPKLYDTETGITAFAGGGQTGATQLTAEYNKITTVTTDLDSVKLPSAKVGARAVVINADGGQTTNVYPQTGELFEGLTANTPQPLVAQASLEVICFVTGTWTLLG